ncbi:MAG TPA: hypothetical protein DG761_05265 [Gammaproteobacteria bacterium]|jgi:endonuclease YncB( thermonuclease family)|nr:hypothetical protein [Acidiferrobacteraceae bacterium]HCX87412.1 hypothetical protein [Gammaproteobacteria bacterium]|tara:strand:+ start:2022 stop:2597 length:576 start_codon:yes stop_codon:yes gene_type:complete
MGFRLFIGSVSLCVAFWATALSHAQPLVTVYPEGGLIALGEDVYRLDGSTLPHPDALCRGHNGDWQCGEAAWQALAVRVRNGTLECAPLIPFSASATEGLPAKCTLDGESLNAWLVRQGWALTDDTPAAPFQAEEALAQQEALGIWRGGFRPPQNWRAAGSGDCSVCSARHESIVRSREQRQQSAGEQNTD